MSQTNTIPWSFIETTLQLTNFSSTGTVIYETGKIPDGFLGVIRDANVIFTTNGGGIYFQKRSRGGTTTRFTDNFTTTATGLNALVVGGDKIQVVIGSTGVGVVDLVWHGELQALKSAEVLKSKEEHIFATGDGV